LTAFGGASGGIQGFLRFGGKSAAFGRNDEISGRVMKSCFDLF